MVTSINSLGANALSGLNPNGISAAELYGRVSKSLLAQNASVQKISAALTRDHTRLSGLGQLRSALADFQALAQSISGTGLQTGATAASPAVLTALTNANAKPGTYQVDVKQLAQAQVLAARLQSRQDQAIGSGAGTAIKVEFGTTAGSSFTPGKTAKTITIDSSNNTLQGIAKAFKEAGVEARIVKGGSGYTLQLGGATGSANSLRISVGGDVELQKLLSYNPAGGKSLTELTAAQDAQLTIDGKSITSASNVITGQITGTALALAGKGATKLVVAQDSGAIARNVGNFVDGLNKLQTRLADLGKDQLKSDPAAGQVREQLSQLLKRSSDALAKVGITQDKNGALQIDSKALKEAIAADQDGVAKLFTNGGKGIADQFAGQIGQLIGANGTITKQKVTIDRGITALTGQQTTLTKALTAHAEALVSQYTRVQNGGAGGALPGLTGGGSSLFDFLA